MADIVTQLSDAQAQCERCPNCCHCDLHQNAIDEILRLHTELAAMRRQALKNMIRHAENADMYPKL